MTKSSNSSFEEVRTFWEERYGKKLSDEDVREIIENISGYFNLLAKWDAESKEKESSNK